jgi:hypothetical protein
LLTTRHRSITFGLSGLVGLVLALCLLAPSAQAHQFSSHDFESVPGPVVPAALATGITVEMIDYDDQVRLRNNSGKQVIVEGYDGEPYARLEPDGGVFLNSSSPAFYLNQDRYATTPVGPTADPEADPVWVAEADDGTLTWFDKRSHYMGQGTPPAVVDPEQPQNLGKWEIPISVAGSPARLTGTLYWSGKTPFPMEVVAGLLVATFLVAGLGALSVEALRRGNEGSD